MIVSNELRNKGIKCNKPKYLKKNDHYILPYYIRSMKIENNNIRLTVGEHISKNYNNI